MEIANVFWHGELTNLEKISVKSLIKNGFHVKLWSYNNLYIEGAESCDANLVLSEAEYHSHEECHMINTSLKKARATSYSDMFRYYLANKFEGWWFDADVICLKNVEEFKKLKENKVVAGFLEKSGFQINGAVLYINKELSNILLSEFESFMNNKNRDRSWGSYGPSYFTDFIYKHDLDSDILPYNFFYAIHWNEFHVFTNANFSEQGHQRLKNSYVAHIWNTEFELRNIDKNNPPKGSLLDQLFASFD
jgi:hypothetical protein